MNRTVILPVLGLAILLWLLIPSMSRLSTLSPLPSVHGEASAPDTKDTKDTNAFPVLLPVPSPLPISPVPVSSSSPPLSNPSPLQPLFNLVRLEGNAMKPTFQTGDMAMVMNWTGQPPVGLIILFAPGRGSDSSDSSDSIEYRVGRVHSTGQDHKGWYAITKQDGLPEPDPYRVRESDIVGVFVMVLYNYQKSWEGESKGKGHEALAVPGRVMFP